MKTSVFSALSVVVNKVMYFYVFQLYFSIFLPYFRRISIVFLLPFCCSAALILTCSAPVVFAAKELPTVQEHLNSGKQSFQKGNYAEAMDQFMQALLIDPQNSTARRFMERSAEKLLEPEKKRIESERKKILKEFRKTIAKRKVESLNVLYSKMVSDYKKQNYLKAYGNILKIVAVDSSYKNVSFYSENIVNEMKEIADLAVHHDPEKLSYAKGFVAYYFNKDLHDAVLQWQRVIAINARRTEVAEYLKEAQNIIAIESLRKRNEELNQRLSTIFNAGQKEFDEKDYVPAVREWEKIIEVARKEKDFPDGPSWEKKARDSINLALEELQKIREAAVKKPTTKGKAAETKKPEPEVVIDEAAANRYYQEGLVSYAQGRLRDAVRSWDLALRMNPNHERAKKAKEKAEAELSAGR